MHPQRQWAWQKESCKDWNTASMEKSLLRIQTGDIMRSIWLQGQSFSKNFIDTDQETKALVSEDDVETMLQTTESTSKS